MKVLHITPAYVPSYKHGGPIKSVHYLNKYLVRRGVDVTVYTTSVNGAEELSVPLKTPVIIDGVRVVYFKPSFPRAWSYSRGMHCALTRNIGQFDLIHITSVFLATSTLGARYAKKFGKPYLISPRGSLMYEPLHMKSSLLKHCYLALVEARNLRDANTIHFTSEAEEEEYRHAGFPLRCSAIIPNSFDAEDFEHESAGVTHGTFGILPSTPIVLSLGRLSWKKGFDTLIPAFKEVLKSVPDAALVVAGGDEEGYKKKIQSLIAGCQLQGKVIFTGMLLGADRVALLKRSKVFVLPSYSENFGMAVIEAMYCEIPVVVTGGVGIATDIKRAGAGFVVQKEPAAVAAAIVKVLQGEIPHGMGEQGKTLVMAKFGALSIAEQMALVYDDLVRKSH